MFFSEQWCAGFVVIGKTNVCLCLFDFLTRGLIFFSIFIEEIWLTTTDRFKSNLFVVHMDWLLGYIKINLLSPNKGDSKPRFKKIIDLPDISIQMDDFIIHAFRSRNGHSWSQALWCKQPIGSSMLMLGVHRWHTKLFALPDLLHLQGSDLFLFQVDPCLPCPPYGWYYSIA